jgi:hypothetical protein
MAGQKSKRSRKRRRPSSPPRAVPSQRREQRAERASVSDRQQRAAQRQLGTVGDRPPSPFGGLPVSEIAIFAGAVALIVGLAQGGGPAVIAGVVLCGLGVLEVTAREHFSGYRSHSTLLAGIPAVAVEVAVVTAFGRNTAVLGLAVIPVFVILFLLLRRRFELARHARVTRPPAP